MAIEGPAPPALRAHPSTSVVMDGTVRRFGVK